MLIFFWGGEGGVGGCGGVLRALPGDPVNNN